MAGRTIRVFIASPSDVAAERDALAKLVAELNLTIAIVAPEKQIFLEIARWETDVFPSAGRPQAVITEQIGEYDIFVGIMWTRFGTPSGVAGSGTEEEFNLAYESWMKRGRPQIMFYFCQASAPPPGSSAAAEQLLRLVKFRQELSEKALVWEYTNHDEFSDVVRPHLLQVLKRAMAVGKPAPYDVPTIGHQTDLSFVQSAMEHLAAEYNRIRESMPSGDVRTRQMENIVTRMRTMALTAVPLLPTFSTSASPGVRLAAIAILQVTPQQEYIEWLGSRRSELQPFMVYHTGVALLTSARALDCIYGKRLESEIRESLRQLGDKRNTDRYRVLMNALEELRAHCPDL